MQYIKKYLTALWVCAMLGLVTSMFFSSRIQFAGKGMEYSPGDEFYQVGEIFEFSDSQVAGAKDITKQGRIRWTFNNPFYGEQSSYLIFFIEGAAANEHTVTVRLQDENKEDIQQVVQFAQEGWNIAPFSVQETKRFRIVLDIGDDSGVAITAVKVLEQQPVGYGMFAIGTAISFCVYFAGYILYTLWKKKHGLKNWYEAVIETVQMGYIRLGRCGMWCTKRTGKFWAGVLRQILWTMLFWCCFMTGVNGNYFDANGHRNLVVICSLLLVGIGMLCAETDLKYKMWDMFTAKSYFAFAALLTLSDFMLHKKVGGEGIVLLLIIPFVAFMWKNMERQGEFLRDLVIGVWMIAGIILLDRLLWGVGMPEKSAIFWSDLATNSDRKRVLKQFFWTLSPWGHNSEFTCFGETQAIYSGAFGVLYRYGVYAFIPYVVMLAAYVGRLLKNFRQKWYVSVFGLGLLIISCVTDFELVFGSWYWILFYLCMWYFIS